MEKEIQTLKEFIHEKFESHEELEALRFKRIDELLSQYGRDGEGNSETMKRVHTRVDRLETQIKTVKSFGAGIATLLGRSVMLEDANQKSDIISHWKINGA